MANALRVGFTAGVPSQMTSLETETPLFSSSTGCFLSECEARSYGSDKMSQTEDGSEKWEGRTKTCKGPGS